MTALTLELPPELYARLRAEADRLGRPAEAVAQEWLAERLDTPTPAPREDAAPESLSDRDRSTAALRAAGLLTELGPEGKRRAARSRATLEEVSAALSRAGGKPLSEIILEMRGPKE